MQGLNSNLLPQNGMALKDSTILEPGVYYLPDGLELAANGITLDGNGALLVGNARQGSGLRAQGVQGVTIKNIRIQEYYHGIQAKDCQGLTISNCGITSTAEVASATIFLDVWLPAERSYGGGIFLQQVSDSLIEGNDLQHQMNGLLAYQCKNLTVRANQASYCSGWGFLLFDTSDSLYEANWADFCCRYEPRQGRSGHMGADAAGFLIIYRSCRNKFLRNMARMSGDGFFLAGLSPQYERVGSNDNLFEENDGSYSPNIAFEATFSQGNIYKNNYANRCNYGFWLGFSSDGILEKNQMIGNRQAGIATENGYDFRVEDNLFKDNGHGILLWSKRVPGFEKALPKNDTSYRWLVQKNLFSGNMKAIRIAANQDHGIVPLPASGEVGFPAPAPHHHTIRENRFEQNIRSFDLSGETDTMMAGNIFEHNSDD